MRVYIKYGVSVAALLASLSLVQAQSEHQGGASKEGGAVEHSQPERGKESGTMERAPAAQERGKGDTRTTTPAKEKQPAALREGEHSTREPGKGETRASSAKEKQPADLREGERSAKEPAEPREGERKAQGKDEYQRQSNAAGPAMRRPNIHISRVQKTRLHDALGGSKTIHRYRASEIHFSVEVGTRIPESVIFYDAPAEFIDIDSEFSGYKIVVLDNEILVIDPETREIVEIIPT